MRFELPSINKEVEIKEVITKGIFRKYQLKSIEGTETIVGKDGQVTYKPNLASATELNDVLVKELTGLTDKELVNIDMKEYRELEAKCIEIFNSYMDPEKKD